MIKKLAAEAVGTYGLLAVGIGSALLAAGFPDVGIGLLGVSLSIGITIMAMAFAVGGISGGHFNPAVSFGLAIAGKFDWKDFVPYVIAQCVGGALGMLTIYLILTGKSDFAGVGNFASNGYGELSPGGFNLMSVIIVEVLMTAFFLIIILGSTSSLAPAGFAPISIGLGLAAIHLMSIPVSNTSVNPARSLATAIFADSGALSQVWVFWLAPLAGAALGAIIWKALLAPSE